jgi:hypothetical protein
MTSLERIREYVVLLTAFVQGEMPGPEFEAGFLDMRRRDIAARGDLPHEALEDLFWDVDDYCASPELRTDEGLDEEELRNRTAAKLSRLIDCIGAEGR